jgi:hypothetical protein
VNRVFVHAPQTPPPGMAAAPTYVMVYPPPLALSFATLAVSGRPSDATACMALR